MSSIETPLGTMCSIGEEFLRSTEMNRTRTSMVCADTNAEYSYENLVTLVQIACTNLQMKFGLRKGDVLTIISHNCPEYTIVCLATLLAGGIVSTANSSFTSGELKRQLHDNESSYIFCSQSVARIALSVAKDLPNLKVIFAMGEPDGCVYYSALVQENEREWSSPQIDIFNDIAFLLYSSGTTGLPKGVMLTHYNVLSNIRQFSQPYVRLEDIENVVQEVCIAALPLFHIFGLLTIQLYGLLNGYRIIYLPKFTLKDYLNAISFYRATILHLVPPIITMMAHCPGIKRNTFSTVHLAYTGAATICEEIVKQFLHKTGIPKLRNGYGMTEAGPVLTISPQDGSKQLSVGCPLPFTQAKVVHLSTQRELSSNQPGELLFRGPQIMKGYLKNSKATQLSLDNEGWLHTGDIGYFDEDGHFYVIDRIKDLIKYKAQQVSPYELESVLMLHPGVKEVAVIGVPHFIGGEAPKAYVVNDAKSEVTEERLHEFLKGKVAPHKYLRGGISFVTSLPKSPSGKILKRILKNRHLQSKL